MTTQFEDLLSSLREVARKRLAQRSLTQLNHLLDDPQAIAASNADDWREFTALGWVDAAGSDPRLASMLLTEMAYCLHPGALFSSVGLAGPYISPELGPATLAFMEGPRRNLPSLELDAGGRLSGIKTHVCNVTEVSSIVVTTKQGPRLVDTAHARVHPKATTDKSRAIADVIFDRVPSAALEAVDPAHARAHIQLAVASEGLGVAQRALDMAVEFAARREQFGKPIGSYQAVSHELAEAYVDVELARSLVAWAASAQRDGLGIWPTAAACSAVRATTAAVRTCERSIQVHGGYGFTWENPLHRFYKRALWLHAFSQYDPTSDLDVLSGAYPELFSNGTWSTSDGS